MGTGTIFTNMPKAETPKIRRTWFVGRLDTGMVLYSSDDDTVKLHTDQDDDLWLEFLSGCFIRLSSSEATRLADRLDQAEIRTEGLRQAIQTYLAKRTED